MQHITIYKISNIKSNYNRKKNFGNRLKKSNTQKSKRLKIKKKWNNKTKRGFWMHKE